MKLPKQWKHWCKLAKLRPLGTGRFSRRWYSHLTVKGRGRVWRVNDKEMFQCGDRIPDFDRWALSSICETPVPKTKDEFLEAIRLLLVFQSLKEKEEAEE